MLFRPYLLRSSWSAPGTPRLEGISCRACMARGYADSVPMPKRESVDDYFAQLNDVQRPHLERLRALSIDADSEARGTEVEPAGVRPR